MKKNLNEVKKLQKIAGILKENVNQDQASNPKLHAFIKKVYAEIIDDFGGESPISLGQLANYIYDWMKINDLTPDQTIEEFNWRELTYELGLDTPPNVNEAPRAKKSALSKVVMDTGAFDEEFMDYLRDANITFKILQWNGPGGGNPEVEYYGDQAALEAMIDGPFDSGDAEQNQDYKDQIEPA